MAVTNLRPKRKLSGGRYHDWRKKRKSYAIRNPPRLTKIGKLKNRELKGIGGNRKLALLECDEANVYDPKTKKYYKTKITTVVENPANRHYVRRNILTKGTIIATEKGKARITSRPGQENRINAVLISS